MFATITIIDPIARQPSKFIDMFFEEADINKADINHLVKVME
jgi:hypothetical protein